MTCISIQNQITFFLSSFSVHIIILYDNLRENKKFIFYAASMSAIVMFLII